MKKDYYTVCVFGKSTENLRVAGCHIIKALSKEDALRIREKFGISNPWNAKGYLRITCKKVNLKSTGFFREMNQRLIEHRKQGFGGSIWYEDENGNLQKETI